VIFFGFPPWQNPFGGHQQISQTKLSKLPYVHLLPTALYRRLITWFGEIPAGLMDIKATGISIERFHRILRKEKYEILKRDYYLFNPNYEIKFRLKPKKVIPPFRWISHLRNFYTTAYYAVVKPIE
ncbi:MAG TPA: class I SAM-dependent methyltransferase, partial [Bacteroidales bacterium]|nr:class I SAM-dependent methyltransferase [Bacteroidales bacterium]